MSRLLAAFDKYKGTATAQDLTASAVGAARAAGWAATGVPLADGGEGSLQCLGGPNRWIVTSDALGGSVRAAWRSDEPDAFIEMAEAAGLALIGGPDANDPIAASTRGVGEMIRAALDEGASRVTVFLGGSATIDGGIGAVEVIAGHPRLMQVDLVAATDVSDSFLDAAVVFGAQKGADESQIEQLSLRLEAMAGFYESRFGVDVRNVPGGGAAGGLAGGLVAVGGTIVSGFDVIAAAVDLEGAMAGADLVVTGEGRLDAGSFHGKVVGSVWARARDRGIPVVAIVGICDPGFEPPVGLTIECLATRFGRDASMADAPALVGRVVADLVA